MYAFHKLPIIKSKHRNNKWEINKQKDLFKRIQWSFHLVVIIPKDSQQHFWQNLMTIIFLENNIISNINFCFYKSVSPVLAHIQLSFSPNCVYLTVHHLTIFIIFSSFFSSSIHASPYRLSSLMLRLFFLLSLTVIYPTTTVFLCWHSVQSWTHTRFSVNIHWYEREVLLCCICRNNSSVIFSYLLIAWGRLCF